MKLTKATYINLAIMFVITFAIAMCPPFGAITPFGMKTLGVFVGVLYGWLTVDLLIPSIWGFAAIALMGLMPTANALSTGLGNTQVVVIIMAMAFFGALDAVGVTKVLANWMLTKEILRKSPWILVVGMVVTAFILGLVGAFLAAILLLWQIIVRIAVENDIPKNDGLVSFMVMMVVAAGFCGMFALPFHATTMIFTGYFAQAMGQQIPVIPFIIVSMASFGTVLLGMLLLAKFVFRFDATKFVMSDEIVAEMKNEKTTFEAKVGLIVLALFMLGVILPACIPTMPGGKLLTDLGIGGLALIGMIVLGLVSVKGKGIVDLAKAYSRTVEWPLVLLLSVTFPIAELMRHADAGIMPTIMGIVLPIVKAMGIDMFMLVVMVALGLLTQVTHNIVLGAMFIPFLVPMCVQMGGNPYVMFMVMFFALNASYVTPAASFQSAMIFGFERMDSKWGYILGICFLVLSWISCFVITVPLGNIVF